MGYVHNKKQKQGDFEPPKEKQAICDTNARTKYISNVELKPSQLRSPFENQDHFDAPTMKLSKFQPLTQYLNTHTWNQSISINTQISCIALLALKTRVFLPRIYVKLITFRTPHQNLVDGDNWSEIKLIYAPHRRSHLRHKQTKRLFSNLYTENYPSQSRPHTQNVTTKLGPTINNPSEYKRKQNQVRFAPHTTIKYIVTTCTEM